MFLSLWIAGATGAWRLTEPVPSGFHHSKFGRVALSLAPLVFATWVAVSRVEDYVSVHILRCCRCLRPEWLTQFRMILTETSQRGRDSRKPPRCHLRHGLLPHLLPKPLRRRLTRRTTTLQRGALQVRRCNVPRRPIRVRAGGLDERARRAECITIRNRHANATIKLCVQCEITLSKIPAKIAMFMPRCARRPTCPRPSASDRPSPRPLLRFLGLAAAAHRRSAMAASPALEPGTVAALGPAVVDPYTTAPGTPAVVGRTTDPAHAATSGHLHRPA